MAATLNNDEKLQTNTHTKKQRKEPQQQQTFEHRQK